MRDDWNVQLSRSVSVLPVGRDARIADELNSEVVFRRYAALALILRPD